MNLFVGKYAVVHGPYMCKVHGLLGRQMLRLDNLWTERHVGGCLKSS